MLTSSAKAKGRALQNQVARDLAAATGLTAGRPDDDRADFRGRQMGQAGQDIIRSLAALDAAPFYVSCKNAESWGFGPRLFGDGLTQLVRWYLDACRLALKEERGAQNIPLLVAAKNRQPPVAVFGTEANKYWSERFSRPGRPIRILVPMERWTKEAHPGSEVVVMLWRDFLQSWYGKEAGR